VLIRQIAVVSALTVTSLAIAGEDVFQSPFTWDLVGKNLFCLVFLGIFFFILTICIEYQFWYYKLLFLIKRRYDMLFCESLTLFGIGHS